MINPYLIQRAKFKKEEESGQGIDKLLQFEASIAEGRDFICMENDKKSFLDTKKRIQERLSKPELLF